MTITVRLRILSPFPPHHTARRMPCKRGRPKPYTFLTKVTVNTLPSPGTLDR